MGTKRNLLLNLCKRTQVSRGFIIGLVGGIILGTIIGRSFYMDLQLKAAEVVCEGHKVLIECKKNFSDMAWVALQYSADNGMPRRWHYDSRDDKSDW